MERRADKVNVALFDPRVGQGTGADIASCFVRALAAEGTSAMVTNVSTSLMAVSAGDHVLPLTVNEREGGGSYVCDPHAAYVDYARRELELVGMRGSTLMARVIGAAGFLLRGASLGKIAQLDNWLLSTNLHGTWRGDQLAEMRRVVMERYPDHLLAIRSVDPWSCADLYRALIADGWTMVPSRQIWVMDDVRGEWPRHNAFANDRRLLKRSRLEIQRLTVMTHADAAQIAALYGALYLGKYSRLNPAFTPRFIAMSQAIGMISFQVARDSNGVIRAVAGSYVRDGVLTPPIVGYDTAAPRRDGLYRIATWMFMQEAAERRLRLNASAGAAHFKRLRGARGIIEYWPMYTRHLAPSRRAAVAMLARVLERWAVPMMKRHQL